jgi:hypothetical protein
VMWGWGGSGGEEKYNFAQDTWHYTWLCRFTCCPDTVKRGSDAQQIGDGRQCTAACPRRPTSRPHSPEARLLLRTWLVHRVPDTTLPQMKFDPESHPVRTFFSEKRNWPSRILSYKNTRFTTTKYNFFRAEYTGIGKKS